MEVVLHFRPVTYANLLIPHVLGVPTSKLCKFPAHLTRSLQRKIIRHEIYVFRDIVARSDLSTYFPPS